MTSIQMKAKIHASTDIKVESNALVIHAPVREWRLLIHRPANASGGAGAVLLHNEDRRVMADLSVGIREGEFAEPSAGDI